MVSKIRIQLEELKAAIAEIEGRTKDIKISVDLDDNKLKLSANDSGENVIEAIIYQDGNLGAQFRCTERLMFMKEKKRL